VQRGEVRWYTFAAPDKKRPVLLLARDVVVRSLNEIIVVPGTRTTQGSKRKWY
jgi:mRNA interferase MazF